MLSENQNEGNIEMTLPQSTPTEFCKAFIRRELKSYQGEQPICMSYWPILERMIERAEELKRPFGELIDRFGYADKFEGPQIQAMMRTAIEKMTLHQFMVLKRTVMLYKMM